MCSASTPVWVLGSSHNLNFYCLCWLDNGIELSLFLCSFIFQSSKGGDWTTWEEVGLKPVFKKGILVKPGDLHATVSKLADNMVITSGSIDESDWFLFQPALRACESINSILRFRQDLQLYLECLIAHHLLDSPSDATFLVTEDHNFFSSFIASHQAETTLQDTCKQVLDIPTAVKVVVAGDSE